jgi:cytochrome c-type biogenesis protein CcmH/NrfF
LLWAPPVVALLAGLLLALFGRRQRAAQAAPLTEDEHARLRRLIEP